MPPIKTPPRRKPIQINLTELERRKLERIADAMQVSLGEAARTAIRSYEVEEEN
jgi:hypothetical protein